MCVTYSGRTKAREPEVAKSAYKIWFEEDMVFQIQRDSSTIGITVTPAHKASNCSIILRSMIQKLWVDINGENVKWVQMLKCDNHFLSYEKAKSKQVHPWFHAKQLDDDEEKRKKLSVKFDIDNLRL